MSGLPDRGSSTTGPPDRGPPDHDPSDSGSSGSGWRTTLEATVEVVVAVLMLVMSAITLIAFAAVLVY